jgi:hypothetical protein
LPDPFAEGGEFDLVDHLLHHVGGLAITSTPSADPQNHHEFRYMQQHQRIAARKHETAQRRGDNDETAD